MSMNHIGLDGGPAIKEPLKNAFCKDSSSIERPDALSSFFPYPEAPVSLSCMVLIDTRSLHEHIMPSVYERVSKIAHVCRHASRLWWERRTDNEDSHLSSSALRQELAEHADTGREHGATAPGGTLSALRESGQVPSRWADTGTQGTHAM